MTARRASKHLAGLARVSASHGHTWPSMQRVLRAAGCAIPTKPIALARLVHLVALGAHE